MKVATLLFGLGIVGAAFAMPWGAEAAEHDIPRALALITVALLAILPEYAGDIIFAWKAGGDSAFAAYAFANMTGFNRVLLGLSWPTVAVLTWAVRRQPIVRLDRSSVPGLLFLGLTTLYSFWLPRKATISLIDSVVLIGLFIAYAALAARSEMVEPVLAGPAAAIEALPSRRRRTEVIGLFAYAAAAVAVSAEAFADGLVRTGRALGEEGDAAEFRYSLGHRNGMFTFQDGSNWELIDATESWSPVKGRGLAWPLLMAIGAGGSAWRPHVPGTRRPARAPPAG